MSARLLGRYEPGSPEWLALRANRIGGSEIGALLGLSTFESPFSLWHRKAGLLGPQDDNPEMEWGRRLEPAVARKFCDEHPEYVAMMGGQYVHDERDYQTASPDLRLAAVCACPVDPEYGEALIHFADCDPACTALLEVKTARYGDEWGTPGTAEIPAAYLAQVQWYMDCLDLPTAHVAVLIGGSDYREYVVPYNPADALMMRARAVEFLATVATGQRPPIDGTTATWQAIRETHPDIDGTAIELDIPLALEYLEARIAYETAKARDQRARSEVAVVMDNAKTAWCCDHLIASRQSRLDGTPYLVAARKLPDPTELRSTAA